MNSLASLLFASSCLFFIVTSQESCDYMFANFANFVVPVPKEQCVTTSQGSWKFSCNNREGIMTYYSDNECKM